MTIKEVSSVIDDINEYRGQHGVTYYVTCFFTDETVGSAGKKKYEHALELRGLLYEAIGQEMDFQLESNGQTKSGKDKFKILGFGTPGGAATYTAPGVQGGERSTISNGGAPSRGGRSPEQFLLEDERIDRRRSAELATAKESQYVTFSVKVADAIYEWLRQTSEPASSEYEQPAETVPPQAGAGSEQSSPAVGERSSSRVESPVAPGHEADMPRTEVGISAAGDSSSAGELSSLSTPTDSATGDGVDFMGKEPAPSPDPHIHDWRERQGLRGFLACDCGKTRKKEGAAK